MEERTVAAHRLYLTALMRIEALDDADDTSDREGERLDAEAAHRRTFVTLNLLLNELGYVPAGLATRSELAMVLDCEAAPGGECRGRAYHERRAALLG